MRRDAGLRRDAALRGDPSPQRQVSGPDAAQPRPHVPWRGAVITVCLAVWPFVTFLATNGHEGVRVEQVVPYAAMVLYVGVAVVGLTWGIRGALSADRVAIAVGGGWFVTVNYPGISGVVERLGLPVSYQLLGWGLLVVAVVAVMWWASQQAAMRLWSLLFAILITAIPVLQVTQHRRAVSDAQPVSSAAVVAGLERTPDIYYVIPDGYGRADRLETMAGFDNSDFLRMLEDRGFVVAHDAYANYPTTFLSVVAALQMDYPVEPGPEALTLREDGERLDRGAFHEISRGDSTLVETLRDAGYRHVQAPPGTWGGSECSGDEDLCVDPVSEFGSGVVLGEVEWALLQMTPAADLLSGLGATFDDVDADPVHTVQEIQHEGFDEPVFALIHMMHTHPPFRFDADCSPLDTGGRDLEDWGRELENVDAWAAGVQCANRRLEAMLDVLPRDAVVVIQSDHGSNFLAQSTTPVDEWSDEQIEDRFGVLSAVRLPQDCRDMVDDRFAGVNTFRVVLACLSGEEPDLLPNRSMIARYRDETAVREVDLVG